MVEVPLHNAKMSFLEFELLPNPLKLGITDNLLTHALKLVQHPIPWDPVILRNDESTKLLTPLAESCRAARSVVLLRMSELLVPQRLDLVVLPAAPLGLL